jgi:uncharacterized protein (TIGR03435 family)
MVAHIGSKHEVEFCFSAHFFFGLIILGLVAFGAISAGSQSQTSMPWLPDWQNVAGNKQSFEVASVRQSKPDSRRRDNLDLAPLDSFSLQGGLFSTNVSLDNYIIFAYKITDGSQYQSLAAQLPKWARSPNKFDIEARAAGTPTKRSTATHDASLVGRSLQTTPHTETKQLPVYALVLDNPSKIGTQLTVHPDNLPCPDIPTSAVHGPEPPSACGLIQTRRDGGLFHMRMLDVSMEVIAGYLAPVVGRMGGLDDRPTIDRTGLSGKYDFTIAFQPEPIPNPQDSTEVPSERSGPGLTEALKRQLGFRLLNQEGPVNTVVIDHVEIPSDN